MIALDRLTAGYDGVPCVRDVTASLTPGHILAIVGPNGSGKSTLLKAVAGLLNPMGGSITLDGADMRRMPARERARHISFLPQQRSAPELTVFSLVSHGRYPHMGAQRRLTADDKQIVREAMRRAGVESFASRLVSRLSGGERQKAYLAMLLCQQAPTVLLDEPTTYLDPSAQFELMALLRELANEGTAVVLVLHDLPLALSCADRLLVLDHGRMIALDTPQALTQSGTLESVFSVHIERTPGGLYAVGPKA